MKENLKRFFERLKLEPCLVELIICAVLWCAVPFAAIRIPGLYRKPTAFQVVMHGFTHFSEFLTSSVYVSAIVSGIAVVFCFVLILKKKYMISRIIALIAEIPMAVSCVQMYGWLQEEGFGLGFWGIAIFLLIIILFGRDPEDTEE